MNAPSHPTIPLLELDLLRTLVAISDTGNFSAAAEIVHRTPSAISMQVKKIEEMLGRPVFYRDSRSVHATIDGEQLVQHGRRMLALNRDMVARFVTPSVQGEVRLGAPDDAAERMLPDMLRRFASTHPCVTVTVVVDSSDKLLKMTRAGELDMTLVTCGAGYRTDEGSEILLEEQLVWATLAGGIAAEQDPLPLSVWENTCVWRQAAVTGLDNQGRNYRIAFQSANISGQRAAILADLAVAPLPCSGLGGKIVEASSSLGLPKLPTYCLSLVIKDNPTAPILAAADHLRASFARDGQTAAIA